MIYWIESGKLRTSVPEGKNGIENRSCWGLFSFHELEEAAKESGIDGNFLSESFSNRATRYESHDGFDFMSLSILSMNDSAPLRRVCVYLDAHRLLFFCDDTAPIQSIVEDIADDTAKSVNFERLLYAFFEYVTSGDVETLESIEQDISEIEDTLITSKKRDCVAQIIHLRKKLMLYKRYYEQLLNILDGIQKNENGLIDKKALRYFKIYEGRVDRLYHSVLHMRDYVTQVREAYQAEVDISLNNIMKIFTVLTAIFFPLTLIVGWYGMNLQMPEFNWKYGYPMVIGISAAVLTVCLIILKRNRWFR